MSASDIDQASPPNRFFNPNCVAGDLILPQRKAQERCSGAGAGNMGYGRHGSRFRGAEAPLPRPPHNRPKATHRSSHQPRNRNEAFGRLLVPPPQARGEGRGREAII
jgi:hypothetical protein